MNLSHLTSVAVVAFCLMATPAQAQFGLFKSALQKGYDAYEKEDFEAALKHWTKAAGKGDAEAQYRLGRLYDRGEGTEMDPATDSRNLAWRSTRTAHPECGSAARLLRRGRRTCGA